MSKLYPLWKQELMKGTSDAHIGTSATVKAYLIDVQTFAQNDTHDSIDEVTTGIAQAQAGGNSVITIDNKTHINGVFDTSDPTDTFVAVGQTATQYEALIIWRDTGTPITSRLVAYIDGFAAVTPNNGDIIITWDNLTNISPVVAAPASGIFAL